MFNFMKLDRRIKLKGFENILYSTTGERPVQLTDWELELPAIICCLRSREIPGIPAAEQQISQHIDLGFQDSKICLGSHPESLIMFCWMSDFQDFAVWQWGPMGSQRSHIQTVVDTPVYPVCMMGSHSLPDRRGSQGSCVQQADSLATEDLLRMQAWINRELEKRRCAYSAARAIYEYMTYNYYKCLYFLR